VSINPTGAAGVPLTVLGGWVTEMAPVALPPGVSPDCADLAFLPGSAYSRPCLEKLLQAFPKGTATYVPTVVYAKSFVTASGDIKNLYLDSNGNLWLEDWTNAPGAYSIMLSVTPGSYCQSITAFGREFFAFSDGLNPTFCPYQYDGTYIDRLTQDAPGLPPTVTSVALSSSQMTSSGNTLTRQDNLVTAVTATAHNLQVGYQAQISNVPDSNATSVVQTNTSTTQSTGGTGGTYWSYVGTQWRSNFNPGTSPLSAMQITGLGFTIPSAATILGVIVSLGLVSQSTTTGTLSTIALWNGGSQIGTAKTPATNFTTTVTSHSYGSAGDAWSASLTPAIVNSSSFGFAVACQCDSTRVFLQTPFKVQVYYTLSGSGTVANVESIVINNESYPGLALVTTTTAHGLIPGIDVSIVGVEPGTISSIADAQWSSGTTTLTTQTNHNLSPGTVIQVSGVTTLTGSTTFGFNGTFTVMSVPSPNQISYYQVPITATDPDVINANTNTGTITISWPIPDSTPTPTYFTVQSCPSPTTFYVQVTYSDGTWSTGTVGFIWEGIFYVTEVVDANTFVYQQYGPNGATTAVGTVTPYGQAAPGLHLCQVLFLNRQGGITAPSAPTTFIANGGQYLFVSDIPIGPSNTVARILAFTGAQPNVPGELPPFFYIPLPGQLEGQIVSTATQIDDNVTTSVILDFSDNTLYAAIGISTSGNNLSGQIVLDGALGFSYFSSRLTTFGQRNVLQNLVNMGFEGGYVTSNAIPAGWTLSGSGTILTIGPSGIGTSLSFSVPSGGSTSASITQGFYRDAYGTPIADANQYYSFRAWGEALSGTHVLHALISSNSTGLASLAQANITMVGGQFVEADFSVVMPATIPSDLQLTFWFTSTSGGTVLLDEISIYPTDQEFLSNQAFTSYTNNSSGFNGLTGNLQPTEDTHKLMGLTVLRGTPYMHTQDPSGRLHEIIVNPTSEPSGWTVREVSANCGTLSTFGLMHSQADDQSGAGAEDWTAWPSEGGATIFDGSEPRKISQEIQPNWNTSGFAAPWVDSSAQINMAAAKTIQCLNDPVERIMYFFVPLGTAVVPTAVYTLSYRELNGASAIVNSPPFHPSLSGRLVATDNTRKWCPWMRTLNGAARMYQSNGELTTVFYAGNGLPLGAAAGFGNVYALNPLKYTDDDYGQVNPFYTTCFFLDPEQAQSIGITASRIMLAYLTSFISGVGTVTYSFLCGSLSNVWSISTTRNLSLTPNFDQEVGGGMAQGNRIAIRIASSPLTGQTDNGFNLQRIQGWWRAAKLKVRGSAT
jgi:hypothetical protein